MPRLPTPGSDAENWGNLLNEFLRVAHNEDGSLRSGSSLFLNVKNFGAKGDGITDDTAAIQTAIHTAQNGDVVYFPPGSYLINQEHGLLFSVPNLVLQGSARATTRIVAGSACKQLIQSQAVPAVHAGAVELRDLTFDGGPAYIGLLAVYGSIMASIYLHRCEFRRFNIGAGLQDFRNALITECTFTNLGRGTGTAIYINAGSADCTIVGCRFLWCNNGILIDAENNETIAGVVQNITIERNYFDLGWYTLPAQFSGTGAYADGRLTDPAGNFTGRGVSKEMYVRVMHPLFSGKVGAASVHTLLVDPNVQFMNNNQTDIIVGDLIEVATGGSSAFAVIAKVIDAHQIEVEEWLDEQRQPQTAPPVDALYTIYKVYLGWTTDPITDPITEQSVTLYDNRWFDLNGSKGDPAAGSRYDFLPRPNYPIHMTAGVRQAKISNNTIKRGYSDQISYWGNQAIITGNHILWGQDMGITLNGAPQDGHSIVAQNYLYKSGAGGIFVSAEHTAVANNVVTATTWVNSVNTEWLGAIILGGAKQVTVTGNLCNGQNLPHAYAGIVVADAQNVTLSANRVSNVTQFAVKMVGSNVTNLRITQEALLTESVPVN